MFTNHPINWKETSSYKISTYEPPNSNTSILDHPSNPQTSSSLSPQSSAHFSISSLNACILGLSLTQYTCNISVLISFSPFPRPEIYISTCIPPVGPCRDARSVGAQPTIFFFPLCPKREPCNPDTRVTDAKNGKQAKRMRKDVYAPVLRCCPQQLLPFPLCSAIHCGRMVACIHFLDRSIYARSCERPINYLRRLTGRSKRQRTPPRVSALCNRRRRRRWHPRYRATR